MDSLSGSISTPSWRQVRTAAASSVRLYGFHDARQILVLLGLFALTSPKTAALAGTWTVFSRA
jgi:hypothetical protein